MSYFIGIDVSKEKLDCACLRNKEQKKARIMACSNNAIGFKLLVEWSEKTTGLLIKELSFIIEPTIWLFLLAPTSHRLYQCHNYRYFSYLDPQCF